MEGARRGRFRAERPTSAPSSFLPRRSSILTGGAPFVPSEHGSSSPGRPRFFRLLVPFLSFGGTPRASVSSARGAAFPGALRAPRRGRPEGQLRPNLDKAEEDRLVQIWTRRSRSTSSRGAPRGGPTKTHQLMGFLKPKPRDTPASFASLSSVFAFSILSKFGRVGAGRVGPHEGPARTASAPRLAPRARGGAPALRGAGCVRGKLGAPLLEARLRFRGRGADPVAADDGPPRVRHVAEAERGGSEEREARAGFVHALRGHEERDDARRGD